jgi:hypothetical protein
VLGFLEVTQRGRMAAADFHVPSRYRLTYLITASNGPTDEWSKIATDEEAAAALQAQPRKEKVPPGPPAKALRVSAPAQRPAQADGSKASALVLPSRDIDRGGKNAPGTVGAKTPPEQRRYRGKNAPGPRGENAPRKLIPGRREVFSRNAISDNGSTR